MYSLPTRFKNPSHRSAQEKIRIKLGFKGLNLLENNALKKDDAFFHQLHEVHTPAYKKKQDIDNGVLVAETSRQSKQDFLFFGRDNSVEKTPKESVFVQAAKFSLNTLDSPPKKYPGDRTPDPGEIRKRFAHAHLELQRKGASVQSPITVY